jgi:hypothetical protein
MSAALAHGILKKDLGRGARAITIPARGSGEIPERLVKGAPSPKSLRGIWRAAVGGQG